MRGGKGNERKGTLVFYGNSRILHLRKKCLGMHLGEIASTMKESYEDVRFIIPETIRTDAGEPCLINNSVFEISILFPDFNNVWDELSLAVKQKLEKNYRVK